MSDDLIIKYRVVESEQKLKTVEGGATLTAICGWLGSSAEIEKREQFVELKFAGEDEKGEPLKLTLNVTSEMRKAIARIPNALMADLRSARLLSVWAVELERAIDFGKDSRIGQLRSENTATYFIETSNGDQKLRAKFSDVNSLFELQALCNH